MSPSASFGINLPQGFVVIGGAQRIASLEPKEIEVSVSFNDWSSQIQFYEPKVNLPFGLLNWKDISPKNLEIAVAREIR